MTETILYYRVADGVLLGSTTVEGASAERELASWGPGVAFIKVAQKPDTHGKIVKVINGVVVSVDDLIFTQKKFKREQDRASAIDKLKKLGLTDDEIKALR